jgi:hypothetical protein
MPEQVVHLEPGESKEVVFEITPQAARKFNFTIDGLSKNVQVKSLPLSPFIYGPLSFSGGVVRCVITNPNLINIKRTVSLVKSYTVCVPGDGCISGTSWYNTEVTIPAGEDYDYSYGIGSLGDGVQLKDLYGGESEFLVP